MAKKQTAPKAPYKQFDSDEDGFAFAIVLEEETGISPRKAMTTRRAAADKAPNYVIPDSDDDEEEEPSNVEPGAAQPKQKAAAPKTAVAQKMMESVTTCQSNARRHAQRCARCKALGAGRRRGKDNTQACNELNEI